MGESMDDRPNILVVVSDTLRTGHVGCYGNERIQTPALDAFALGDALLARGWYHDRQGPPDNLHSTVSNTNTGVIDDYLTDLAECVAAVVGTSTTDRSTTYATLE